MGQLEFSRMGTIESEFEKKENNLRHMDRGLLGFSVEY